MTHKGHAVCQVKRIADVQQVLRIAFQLGVSFLIESLQVGLTGADLVKQNLGVGRRKRRGDAVPHGLVAAKAIAINKNRAAFARDLHVVALKNIQVISP